MVFFQRFLPRVLTKQEVFHISPVNSLSVLYTMDPNPFSHLLASDQLDPHWAVDGSNTRPMWLPEPDRPTPARPVRALMLGAGNRAKIYGDYALRFPRELRIVGVAEPNAWRREAFLLRHNLMADRGFEAWPAALDQSPPADAVIVATPDHLHHEPAMAALQKGYDLLLEKPIARSEAECLAILRQAQSTGRIVAVCHVLRYAPYFVLMRELIRSGVLGQVVSLQHLEPIHHAHMSHSYVRGP